jgi:hypothetical protein
MRIPYAGTSGYKERMRSECSESGKRRPSWKKVVI